MSNESEKVAGYVPSAEAVEAGARAICIRQGGEPDLIVSGAMVKVPDFPQWAEYAGEATAALSAAFPVEVAREVARLLGEVRALVDFLDDNGVFGDGHFNPPTETQGLSYLGAARAVLDTVGVPAQVDEAATGGHS